MTNEIQIFSNADLGANLRTIQIDGEHWFVAKDVCLALGIHLMPNGQVNVTDATRKLDVDELVSGQIETSPGLQRRHVKLVSESGLYKLIIRSDKPGAS